ncbi:MAG TPA: hypothetical protein VGB93_10200 [Methylovirgula sp.]
MASRDDPDRRRRGSTARVLRDVLACLYFVSRPDKCNGERK